MNWRGTYDPTTSYQKNDVVLYTTGGVTSAYVCFFPTTPGTAPTDTTHWQVTGGDPLALHQTGDETVTSGQKVFQQATSGAEAPIKISQPSSSVFTNHELFRVEMNRTSLGQTGIWSNVTIDAIGGLHTNNSVIVAGNGFTQGGVPSAPSYEPTSMIGIVSDLDSGNPNVSSNLTASTQDHIHMWDPDPGGGQTKVAAFTYKGTLKFTTNFSSFGSPYTVMTVQDKGGSQPFFIHDDLGFHFGTGAAAPDISVGRSAISTWQVQGIGAYTALRLASPGTGAFGAELDFCSADGTIHWSPYITSGDPNFYLKDQVNNRDHMKFIPGASDAAAITELHSSLQTDGNVGFYGTTPAGKPTVTGSRGANAALASLLTALSGLGLLTDSST